MNDVLCVRVFLLLVSDDWFTQISAHVNPLLNGAPIVPSLGDIVGLGCEPVLAIVAVEKLGVRLTPLLRPHRLDRREAKRLPLLLAYIYQLVLIFKQLQLEVIRQDLCR